MNADGTYNVYVYETATHEVVETIAENKSERTSERIKAGVEINLNHDDYYVEVE